MRTKAVRSFIVFIYLFLILVALAGVNQLMARPATRVDPTRIADDIRDILDPDHLKLVASNESPFKPTSVCRQCHRGHDEEWTNSMHYLSWRDPIFKTFYNQYLSYLGNPEIISEETYETVMGKVVPPPYDKGERKERLGYVEEETQAQREVLRHGNLRTYYEYMTLKEVVKDPMIKLTREELGIVIHGEGLLPDGLLDGKSQINCLRCHAPGADLTMDKNFILENNSDGVFCDYCHLIIDRYDDIHYVILINSQIKQGPYIQTVSSSHCIEPSKLIVQSEFCKDCHQYTNPLGMQVFNTYTEWFNSDYNTGGNATGGNITTCQECHMPGYRGRASIVSDVRQEVFDHTFYGGNTPDFLKECATVEVESTIETANILLDVKVKNDKAGHNLPGDSPLRELILIVRLKGPEGETLWQGKRVYRRVYGDLEGNPTFSPWRASQVLSDTTLKPMEERVENFTVPRPDVEGNVYITAQLFYRLTPEDQPNLISNAPKPTRVDHAVHFIQ